MKNNSTTKLVLHKVLILVFIIAMTNTVNAQTDLPEEPVDTAPLPIDNYIPIILMMGIGMGVYFISRKTKNYTKVL